MTETEIESAQRALTLEVEMGVQRWKEIERLRAEVARLNKDEDGLGALTIRLGEQLGAQDIAMQTQQHEIDDLRAALEQHHWHLKDGQQCLTCNAR